MWLTVIVLQNGAVYGAVYCENTAGCSYSSAMVRSVFPRPLRRPFTDPYRLTWERRKPRDEMVVTDSLRLISIATNLDVDWIVILGLVIFVPSRKSLSLPSFLFSGTGSSASLEMDEFCQIELQKDNGKLISFGFLASSTIQEVDLGVRHVLKIPWNSSYSVSFKDNVDEIHMLPSGRMLQCLTLRNIVKLDVNVRPPTPQPQSCNLSIEGWRNALVTSFSSSSIHKLVHKQRWWCTAMAVVGPAWKIRSTQQPIDDAIRSARSNKNRESTILFVSWL